MFRDPFSRFALASILVFGIGGCGDSNSGPDFDDEATTDETLGVSEDAVSLAQQIAYSMDFGTPNIFLAPMANAARSTAFGPHAVRPMQRRGAVAAVGLATWTGDRAVALQAVAANGCSVTSHGTDGSDPFDYLDENGNDIPDDWSLKLVCVAVDSSDTSNVWTYTETYDVGAKEDMSALHGFEGRLHFSDIGRDEEGHSAGQVYTGTEVLDVRTGSVAHRFSFQVRYFEDDEESVTGNEWNATFDPASDIVLGDPLPDGDLDFSGRSWFVNTGDISLSFALESTTPLAYSAACEAGDVTPPFTAGVIRGRLNNSSSAASFEVTFNDCADFTVTTSGTSDEGVPVVARR